jgi:hypothetical protein
MVLVHPDGGALRDDHVLVQDRVLHHGVRADLAIVQDHRPVHPGPAAHPDPWRQHGVRHQPAADDDAVADQAVDRPSVPHEPGRRQRRHVRQDRPPRVVQIEPRAGSAQVHVRVEVGIQRAQVPPVARPGSAGHGVVPEVVHVRGAPPGQHRHDVASHAVLAALIGGILAQRVHQHIGAEHVDAHRRERLPGRAQARRRAGRLFPERLDPVPVACGLHHAEGRRGVPLDRDRRHRDPRAPGQVRLDHLPRVHPVDVVGAKDRQQVRPVGIDEVQRLVDRIGRARLPVRAHPLLRRDRRHVVAQHVAELPGGTDVPVQAVALVLGQHVDAPQPAVRQVGQREINQPVQAADGNGRLGPVRGQRREPPPLPARENNAQDPLFTHRLPPPNAHLGHP